MFKKRFSKIITIVTALIIIGGGILVWQVITDDFRTYKNKIYRIEFEYPREFTLKAGVVTYKPAQDAMLMLRLELDEKIIFMLDTSDDPDMEERLTGYLDEKFIQEEFVDGVLGVRFSHPNTLQNKVFINKYSRLYVFSGKREVLDPILSSFRFLEE